MNNSTAGKCPFNHGQMKQTAGASGGGEDKKLKKNIEYILFQHEEETINYRQSRILNSTSTSVPPPTTTTPHSTTFLHIPKNNRRSGRSNSTIWSGACDTV